MKALFIVGIIVATDLQVLCAQTAVGINGHLLASGANKTTSARFDDLVRDDLFDGILHNDQVAFNRAMTLCREALVKNPNDAPAMAWEATGLLYSSGQAFRVGNVASGFGLRNRGLKEMNDAVRLQPNSLQVLIPRATTYLGIAMYIRDKSLSKELVKTAISDYENVLEIQGSDFSKLGTHPRGEVLSGLADGWNRLGNLEKSREFLRRIVVELPDSDYATRANDWLNTKDISLLRRKSDTISCIGCHE